MTDATSPALQTALAYYDAWTSKDLERVMTYIADDIVCDAPAGRLEGAAAYRDFMGPFVEILLEARLISAFGDEETALVMYDTRTLPVDSAPGAEYVTVEGGKITYSPVHLRPGALPSGTRRRDVTAMDELAVPRQVAGVLARGESYAQGAALIPKPRCER